MEEVLEKDPKIFFLNNLLMTVQFFENYDRDIELLRKNWFKEFSIESHNKKCFFADSLFRVVGKNVKFSLPRKVNKNSTTQLNSLRIYVSSDNMEASYDPAALKSNVIEMEPRYQFTVKPAEDSQNSGLVTLVEFKGREAKNLKQRPHTIPNASGLSDAVNPDENAQESSRSPGLQKLHNEEVKSRILGRHSSLRYFSSAEATIQDNAFHKCTTREERLKHKTIQDFRMNSLLTNSLEIPVQCFQMEEVGRKINSRRIAFREYPSKQKILNSAAFKAYFCDLLIEKLSKPLHLDLKDVNESIVSGEFIIVNQTGMQLYIAPSIPVRDWNDFVVMNKKYRTVGKTKETVWPSNYMQSIINLLPCNAVPTAHSQVFEEKPQPEKMWTLVFPKAEEFLLLHMMHAHIRCYLWVLLIYKSFIEEEINEISLGPRHLMHLLFWRVHKNFFAWPEDRPAETLLNYLKALYKKLQNKSLCDFFITSRNLFASSLAKDLHRAQALIKKIIENPVPYVIRAISYLELESNYYPEFDILELKTTVNPEKTPGTRTRTKKKKRVCEVSLREKNAITQKGKAKEEEQLFPLFPDITDVEEMLNSGTPNVEKRYKVLEAFTSHFVQMGLKSLGYNFLPQALLYLNQSEKLFEAVTNNEINLKKMNAMRKKITELKEACYNKLKTDFPKLSRPFQPSPVKFPKNGEESQTEEERKNTNSAINQPGRQRKETSISDGKNFVEEDDEIVTEL